MRYLTELGTTKVTAPQLEEMTQAINTQMQNDFCQAFGLTPVNWSVLAGGQHGEPW
jgi:hypothetical protein